MLSWHEARTSPRNLSIVIRAAAVVAVAFALRPIMLSSSHALVSGRLPGAVGFAVAARFTAIVPPPLKILALSREKGLDNVAAGLQHSNG